VGGLRCLQYADLLDVRARRLRYQARRRSPYNAFSVISLNARSVCSALTATLRTFYIMPALRLPIR